ncbi:MAG: lipase family protein [Cyanobium sp.]
MIHSIELPIEETLSAEAIQKSNGNVQALRMPQGFKKNLAWELANLIRIAYGDYEKFDHQNRQDYLIQEGDSIWLPQAGDSGLANHFWLQHADPNRAPSEEEAETIEGGIPYKVLAVFTYLAFNLINRSPIPIPEVVPEVDRFGFILKRQLVNGQNDLYLIFRGTMEPSEWFNDFQYKQIPYLMPDQNFSGLGEVCLGINKIYTDFRPGIAIEKKVLNKFSREIDEHVRQRVIADYPDICNQHQRSIKDTVHKVLGALFGTGVQPSALHVAGHSLGAALATISALHAAVLCDNAGAHCPIDLYTFASPRVGDSQFAKACEQRLQAFRIANSEDVVPGIPPATLRVVDEEMNPGPHVEAVRKALAALTGGVSNEVFEHVGTPVVFTLQLGEISSNHNMGHTYCSPLQGGLT